MGCNMVVSINGPQSEWSRESKHVYPVTHRSERDTQASQEAPSDRMLLKDLRETATLSLCGGASGVRSAATGGESSIARTPQVCMFSAVL